MERLLLVTIFSIVSNTSIATIFTGTDDEMIAFITNKHMDVNMQDHQGDAPIHYLSHHQNCYKRLLSLLVGRNDLNINIRNSNGNTPLHIISQTTPIPPPPSLPAQKKTITNATDDIDPDIKPLKKITKQETENIRKINDLLRYGADINLKNNDKNTPLHLACQHNNLEISRYLLHKGADANLTNNKGNTPLHLACMLNKFKLSKLLLEKAADLYLQNDKRESAYLLGMVHGDSILIEFLEEMHQNFLKIYNLHQPQ